MNKPSGGDGIQFELFQILKDDAVKVLHSICQRIWKTQLWPQDWKRSVFISISKKGNAKEFSNYHTTQMTHHLMAESEELNKKELRDPDHHNGVITHLEPDILECEVK